MRCWFFCPAKVSLLYDSHAMYLPFTAVDEKMPPLCLKYSKHVEIDRKVREVAPLRGFITYGNNDTWVPLGIQALVMGLYDFTGGSLPTNYYIVEAEIPVEDIMVLEKFTLGAGLQYFTKDNLKTMYFEPYQTGLHAYVPHIEQQDVVGIYRITSAAKNIFEIQNVYDQLGVMPLINCILYTDGVGNVYSPADDFDSPVERLGGLLVQKSGLGIAYSYMSPIQVSLVCDLSVQDAVFAKLKEKGVQESDYKKSLIDLLGEECADVCMDIVAEEQ